MDRASEEQGPLIGHASEIALAGVCAWQCPMTAVSLSWESCGIRCRCPAIADRTGVGYVRGWRTTCPSPGSFSIMPSPCRISRARDQGRPHRQYRRPRVLAGKAAQHRGPDRRRPGPVQAVSLTMASPGKCVSAYTTQQPEPLFLGQRRPSAGRLPSRAKAVAAWLVGLPAHRRGLAADRQLSRTP